TLDTGYNDRNKPHLHCRFFLEFGRKESKEDRADFLVDGLYSQWLAQSFLASNECGLGRLEVDLQWRRFHEDQEVCFKEAELYSNVHLACKQITSAHENQNTLIFGADAAQRLAKHQVAQKLANVYYAIKPILDTHEPFKTRLNFSGSGYLSQVSFSDEDMPWHNTDNRGTKSKQKGSGEGAVDDLEAAETQFRIPGKIVEITLF
ncbi:hypothetical protein LTS18_009381, partial [Coniosporium uncinatum]